MSKWLPVWLPKAPENDQAVPTQHQEPPLNWEDFWSGWPDLNRRPLRPERSALPSCATPRRPRRESSRSAEPA